MARPVRTAPRLGLRSVTVQKGVARVVGLELKESQKVRLQRLAPRAVHKPEETVIPLQGGTESAAATVRALLRELMPLDAPVPVGSPAS